MNKAMQEMLATNAENSRVKDDVFIKKQGKEELEKIPFGFGYVEKHMQDLFEYCEGLYGEETKKDEIHFKNFVFCKK